MISDIALGYAGAYERFDTISKKEASALVGADNLVGDRFSIEFKVENGVVTAWMKNKFNALVATSTPRFPASYRSMMRVDGRSPRLCRSSPMSTRPPLVNTGEKLH